MNKNLEEAKKLLEKENYEAFFFGKDELEASSVGKTKYIILLLLHKTLVDANLETKKTLFKDEAILAKSNDRRKKQCIQNYSKLRSLQEQRDRLKRLIDERNSLTNMFKLYQDLSLEDEESQAKVIDFMDKYDEFEENLNYQLLRTQLMMDKIGDCLL